MKHFKLNFAFDEKGFYKSPDKFDKYNASVCQAIDKYLENHSQYFALWQLDKVSYLWGEKWNARKKCKVGQDPLV